MASAVESEIYKCIDSFENFVVDAGAGSGKTWSLVQTLRYVINTKGKILKRDNQKVICITYTKVARDEIKKRIEHNSLVKVTTIHDFLWESISPFKTELSVALVDMLQKKVVTASEKLASIKNIKTKAYAEQVEKLEKAKLNLDSAITCKSPVQYKQYPYLKEKIVSHDEVIEIAFYIFSKYKNLNKIVASCYPFIFVDEYQDTHVPVVELLLRSLALEENIILGFFGDKMQKIYETGVGKLPAEIKLKQIKKTENFRCSAPVVSVLNKIRDDIAQIAVRPDADVGSAKFYFSASQPFDIEAMIYTYYKVKREKFKILYLTHYLISKENGYSELYSVFSKHKKTDALIKNEDNRGFCPFADILYDIEEMAELYTANRVQALIERTTFEVNSFETKILLNTLFQKMIKIRENNSIGQIIEYALNSGIVIKNKKFTDYDFSDIDKQEFYTELMALPYTQFISLYQVNNQKTPFTTKHSTKGEEFDNVLSIIDDSAWNHYNFEKYFSDDTSNQNIYERTRNLFYVVCSRARNNLAVFFVGEPSATALQKITHFFGASNVHKL